MSITAAMVKELRERTGAGMMECKKALQETNGDLDAAIEAMRKRGQAKAAKRAGKTAAEGIVIIAKSDDQKQAFLAEINSETDFVAREDSFLTFAKQLAERGLETKTGNLEELLAKPVDASGNGNDTFEQARQKLVAKIGENIQVRRVAHLETSGTIGSYNHGNRIGVIVAIDKNEPELAKDLAMHIAAANPQAIDESGLPSSVIEKEREILTAQAKESGKPDAIVAKMVEGRIAKFLKEICLVGQPFVKDPDQTIGNLLKEHNATVTAFTRYEVGEGIEKESVDFAEEVQSQIKGS